MSNAELIPPLSEHIVAHDPDTVSYTHLDVYKRQFLHGELVAVGLLIQMAFNQCPSSEIGQVRSIMRSMNMPLTLGDIGYDTSPESLEFLIKHLAADSDINTEPEIIRLKNAVPEAL